MFWGENWKEATMEPRDISLFVSDVDGTLLNPQKLTSANWTAPNSPAAQRATPRTR